MNNNNAISHPDTSTRLTTSALSRKPSPVREQINSAVAPKFLSIYKFILFYAPVPALTATLSFAYYLPGQPLFLQQQQESSEDVFLIIKNHLQNK